MSSNVNNSLKSIRVLTLYLTLVWLNFHVSYISSPSSLGLDLVCTIMCGICKDSMMLYMDNDAFRIIVINRADMVFFFFTENDYLRCSKRLKLLHRLVLFFQGESTPWRTNDMLIAKLILLLLRF